MEIRQVDPGRDLKQVRMVTVKSFSETPDSSIDEWFSMEELGKSLVEGRGICFVAVDNEEFVGVIHAMQENPINGREGIEKWVITNLAVVPSATGRGMGGKLLVEIEREAKGRGAKKMFVHTNLDDERVIHFYEKNGYEKAGEIKDYYYAGSAVFLLKYL